MKLKKFSRNLIVWEFKQNISGFSQTFRNSTKIQDLEQSVKNFFNFKNFNKIPWTFTNFYEFPRYLVFFQEFSRCIMIFTKFHELPLNSFFVNSYQFSLWNFMNYLDILEFFMKFQELGQKLISFQKKFKPFKPTKIKVELS